MEKDNDNTRNKHLKAEEKSDNKLPYNPDITEEDKNMLHEKGQSMDTGRDKFLAEREEPVNFSRDDLDIPTGENDDPSNKNKKIPDEENEQFERRGSRTDKDVSKSGPDKIIDDDTEDYS
ncbi:MAG TPA: hypothetical protein VFM70_00910 [Salinimicrobium sp.]|nr:hypothetical protein [Salinimicrobium sp.]